MKEAKWEGFLLIKTYLQTIYSFTVKFLTPTLIINGKVSVCSVGDPGSIPGLERYPGEGNGSPLQYSCLENPMDPYHPWGRKESDTTEQLLFHFSDYRIFCNFFLFLIEGNCFTESCWFVPNINMNQSIKSKGWYCLSLQY